jgi:hypothetical protein
LIRARASFLQIPATTQVPPFRVASNACSMGSGSPMASKVKSAPSPPVSSLMDDFDGSDHSGALDDVESDTAASENGDGGTGAHLRSVGYGSETGDNATTDEGGVFE